MKIKKIELDKILQEAREYYVAYAEDRKLEPYRRFHAFLESLKRKNNTTLIESIQTGISAIMESYVESPNYQILKRDSKNRVTDLLIKAYPEEIMASMKGKMGEDAPEMADMYKTAGEGEKSYKVIDRDSEAYNQIHNHARMYLKDHLTSLSNRAARQEGAKHNEEISVPEGLPVGEVEKRKNIIEKFNHTIIGYVALEPIAGIINDNVEGAWGVSGMKGKGSSKAIGIGADAMGWALDRLYEYTLDMYDENEMESSPSFKNWVRTYFKNPKWNTEKWPDPNDRSKLKSGMGGLLRSYIMSHSEMDIPPLRAWVPGSQGGNYKVSSQHVGTTVRRPRKGIFQRAGEPGEIPNENIRVVVRGAPSISQKGKIAQNIVALVDRVQPSKLKDMLKQTHTKVDLKGERVPVKTYNLKTVSLRDVPPELLPEYWTPVKDVTSEIGRTSTDLDSEQVLTLHGVGGASKTKESGAAPKVDVEMFGKGGSVTPGDEDAEEESEDITNIEEFSGKKLNREELQQFFPGVQAVYDIIDNYTFKSYRSGKVWGNSYDQETMRNMVSDMIDAYLNQHLQNVKTISNLPDEVKGKFAKEQLQKLQYMDPKLVRTTPFVISKLLKKYYDPEKNEMPKDSILKVTKRALLAQIISRGKRKGEVEIGGINTLIHAAFSKMHEESIEKMAEREERDDIFMKKLAKKAETEEQREAELKKLKTDEPISLEEEAEIKRKARLAAEKIKRKLRGESPEEES